ncbi:hypothetical protein WA158_007048 [Blastocystis sp. Blastoise]
MSLPIDGQRVKGEDIRSQNVTACMAIANIVKSSLGPVGLDKMLVDKIGDVTITNDGATILQKLDVEHPAAKVLVELADLQDKEVGDGTTSVVILAAELLKRANDLVRLSVHPTSIMSGYRLALKESVNFIKQHMLFSINDMTDDILLHAAHTSLNSKILGAENDFFSKIAVDAVKAVKTNVDGKDKYPVSSISIIKTHGQSALASRLVNGFALQSSRAAQGMPQEVTPAVIAVLDFGLQRHRLQMGVEVKVSDSSKIEEIKQKEIDITKQLIMTILSNGVNVVVTSKGIDDLCLKYLVENGVIGVRRVKDEDLKRIADATGAQVITNLSDLEGNLSLDASLLGHCDKVYEESLGDYDHIFFEGCSHGTACSIILRGANDFMMEEMERSLHDALCIVSKVLESKTLVVGGGCVESALSVHLSKYSTTLDNMEQLAVKAFADSLLVIPKVLSVNAAKDASDLVAKLCSYHHMYQEDDSYCCYGLDLMNGQVVNNYKQGVVEPAINKTKCLKFAVEACITILRIDDMIKVNPAKQQQDGASTPPIIEYDNVAIFGLCLAFGILSTIYALKTWLTEPGIIPKRKQRVPSLPPNNSELANYYDMAKRCIQCENIIELKELLSKRPDLIKTADPYSTTLLHYAVQRNKIVMVKYLLDHGSSTQAIDIYGLTPFHYALFADAKQITCFFFSKLQIMENVNDILIPKYYEVYQILGEDCGLYKGKAAIPPDMFEIRPYVFFKRIKFSGLCRYCNTHISPRATHCKICDICIRKFDHHCPLMGTCIGLRNHTYYYLFLIYLFCSLLFGIVGSIWNIFIEIELVYQQGSEAAGVASKAFQSHIFGFIYSIYSFVLLVIISPLIVNHTAYISNDLTQHEYEQDHGNIINSIYSSGFIHNWCYALFQPTPLSLIHEPKYIKINESISKQT